MKVATMNASITVAATLVEMFKNKVASASPSTVPMRPETSLNLSSAEAEPYTVLDMFAGAGGTGLGFKRAGFRIVGVVEWNHNAACTYSKNLGFEVEPQDIRLLNPKSYRESLGLTARQLDVLVGCSPCQGFTELRNDKGDGDERNDLVLLYLKFVAEFMPRFVLFENVAGFLRRKHGKAIYSSFCDGLRGLGYHLTVTPLDAADYGIAQHRDRVLVLAGRDGEPPPFPDPTHAPPDSPQVQDGTRKRWRTVRDEIEFLPSLEAGENGEHLLTSLMREVNYYPNHIAPKTGKRVLSFLRMVPQDGGSRRQVPREHWLACHLREPEDGKARNGYSDVYGRLAWDKPAGTMTTGCTNPSKGRFAHPDQDRAITAREAAALQGFPLDFVFYGGDQATQIGNAVPPPLAQAIATSLKERLRLPATLLPPTASPSVMSVSEGIRAAEPQNTHSAGAVDIVDIAVGAACILEAKSPAPTQAEVFHVAAPSTGATTTVPLTPLSDESSASRSAARESVVCSHPPALRALQKRRCKSRSRCKALSRVLQAIPIVIGALVLRSQL